MPLIDKTYFVGELNIPDTGGQAVEERLNFFIAKYEEELLRAALGNALYAAYVLGTKNVTEDAIDQKWKDLRDGMDYTDQWNQAQYWMGFRKESTLQSMIANYVYYWWQRDKISHTSSVGETQVNTDGAERINPGLKMARAWNEMVNWVWTMVTFLDAKRDIYPEWDQQNRCMLDRSFAVINVLNI